MNRRELSELLKSPSRLSFMNSLLVKHQFPEYFLIKTICYYDSWICLRTQKNLSPFFCFRYLYDNETDSADNWTDFHEVYKYLQDNKHSNEFTMNEYHRAMKERNRNMEF
jgi:hypothetical protein